MPKPKAEVRTVNDPEAVKGGAEPAVAEESPDIDELTRRRLRREFLSMEKRRKLAGADRESANGGQPEARLIIKERGGEITPEPRRNSRGGEEVSAGAEEQPGDRAVLRLEKQPSPPRRTHDVAVEVVVAAQPKQEGEDRWTNERKSVSWRWALVIAGGMVGLVIASLVIVQALLVLRQDEGRRRSAPVALEVERIDLGEAKELLEADPVWLYDEAQRVLEGYSSAGSAAEALGWVRRADRDRETLTRVWQPWSSQPYFDRPELIQHGLMSFEDPPALVVWGLREDFSPFRAYFVFEDGRLRLDWRATEVFCDIPITKLATAGEVDGVTVRSLVQEKAFHTAALPDDKFRSFMLSSPDGLNYVWGYAERGGELDLELEDLLNQGTGQHETKSRGRATLVVASPEGQHLDNQFLITEVLHNEWVGP
jgi:hypothetical protein